MYDLVDREFECVGNMYHLPTFQHQEDVDEQFLNCTREIRYFITIALFDQHNRQLLLRDFSKNYGWELLGGNIDEHSFKGLFKSAQDISVAMLGVSVFNVEPIAFMKNVFSHGSKSITHRGIAFLGRCTSKVTIVNDIEWGFFKSLPSHMFTTNHEIARRAFSIAKSKSHSLAIAEVYAAQNLRWRRIVHKKLINPVFDRFSSRKLKRAIFGELGGTFRSFCDVSVGDDEFVIELLKKERRNLLIVCNDISTASLNFLSNKVYREHLGNHVLFTNHDLRNLPFRCVFDVVLVKNTLHHLQTNREIEKLFSQLAKIGKKILVMDIENPRRSGFFARIWNLYYVTFLHDKGGHFLTFSQLSSLLNKHFPSDSFSLRRISTVKGNYLLAVVNPRSPFSKQITPTV